MASLGTNFYSVWINLICPTGDDDEDDDEDGEDGDDDEGGEGEGGGGITKLV